MKYGYCRVSTTKQIAGTSLDEQEQKLCEQGAELIYRDGFTGTSADRPEFQKLLSVLKEDDWFMVTKLDRFARNTQDALNIVNELRDKGVTVQILNMGVVDNTPMGKLMVIIGPVVRVALQVVQILVKVKAFGVIHRSRLLW